MMAQTISGIMEKTIINIILILFLSSSVSGQKKEFFNNNQASLSTCPSGVIDTNATNYINSLISAGSTPTAPQQDALNVYVCQSKVEGSWYANVAIYFPVWSNAAADVINMKNPGVANLTFVGGYTLSNSGITWDGSTGYANTGLTPSQIGTQNSLHVTSYGQSAVVVSSPDFGTSDLTVYVRLLRKFGTSASSVGLNGANATGSNGTQLVGNKMCTISRTLSTTVSRYFAGNNTVNNYSSTSILVESAHPLYLGAVNDGGTAVSFNNRKFSYYDMGLGFTASQELAHYNTVQTLHTAFSIAQ